MMYHCGHMLEQPLVWTIINEDDIFMRLSVISQLRPSLGHDSTKSVRPYSLQYDCGNSLRVFKNDAAEAYVDRRRSTLNEISNFSWWLVPRRIPEEESADVYVARPVQGFRYKSRRPAVSHRNAQCVRKTRTIEHPNLLQVQRLAPLVDNVTKSRVRVSVI
jgi:hypothetical protein